MPICIHTHTCVYIYISKLPLGNFKILLITQKLRSTDTIEIVFLVFIWKRPNYVTKSKRMSVFWDLLCIVVIFPFGRVWAITTEGH